MLVVPIPCLKDNYAYLLHAEDRTEALVVDPSDAGPIVTALAARGLTLTAVLLTHHHWDHVGGLPALLARDPNLRIYAHPVDGAKVAVGTVPVLDGEQVESCVGTVTVMHVPGHTLGAVAYVLGTCLFTGDTLFGGGCGRLFEGTAPQMHASLMRLAALPGDSLLYSGHEYTLQNLAFAAVVERHNLEVPRRIERVRALRALGQPSVPSTLEEERATNPFLRCDSDGFTSLRKQKDEFRA